MITKTLFAPALNRCVTPLIKPLVYVLSPVGSGAEIYTVSYSSVGRTGFVDAVFIFLFWQDNKINDDNTHEHAIRSVGIVE